MKNIIPAGMWLLLTRVAAHNSTEADECTNFHVGSKSAVAAQYKHHGNVTALWYDLLKPRFAQGPAYPINYGANLEDFEPIFQSLIRQNISDVFDERWPQAFLPRLHDLVEQANFQRQINSTAASALYFRANALGHIAHYPSLHTPLRYSIYETQLAAFLNATSIWKDPYLEIQIPHVHAVKGEGSTIPTFYRSAPANTSSPVPVLVRIAGIDGFRSDQPHTVEVEAYESGYAYLILELPGTGASPALPRDPKSPDRMWSSVLDWIDTRPELDSSRVVFWGVSTGGYYGFRVAYTHKDRILGSIGNGGWSNCVLTETWMDIADLGEYPTELSRTFAWKFGYSPTGSGFEQFMQDLPELKKNFSLLEDGFATRDSAPLLIVDGREDTIFPVEDSEILTWFGQPKSARFVPGAHHPGEPQATPIILRWIAELIASVKSGH